MSEKPTYEELEQRVRELEQAESKRKIIEEKSKNSELLSFFIKHSPIYAFLKKVSHKDSQVLYASDNYIDMTGVPASQMVGKTMRELFPKEFAEKITRDDIAVINKGNNLMLDEELNGRNYVTYKFPLMQDGNKYLAGYTVDITDRKRAEEALQESESLFRGMFKDHSAVMLLIDPNSGQIIKANQAAAQYYGYPLEKMLQMKIQQLHVLSPAEVTEKMRYALNQQVNTFEFQHLLADGQVRDVEVHSAPTPFQHQTLLFSIIHDITERKHAETALHESEEKYRVLFHTFPLGITISDQHGKILETNATAVKLLGIPRDEHEARTIDGPEWPIIGRNGAPMPPDEYASVRALKENRLVENVELGIVKPGGETTWLSVTAAPLLLENYGIVVTYGDITDRIGAEQKYQMLFREMLDGFALHEIICDTAGHPVDYRFLAVNPAFEKMTGLKATQIINRTVLDVLPGTEPYWIEAYGKVALSGEPAFFEKYAADIGKHFQVTAFRPAPNQFACIFSDTSARKRAEKEKLDLEGQLRQAHKMEAVGRLAGGVAHDFNNMLSVIIGHAEMTLEQMDPAQPFYDDLEQIKNAAERSADLTRQLLAFARKQTVAPKVIDLNETVAGVIQMLQRLIGEDIDLAWIPGRNVWPVKMDPSQIDQVLANLCVNARDAIADVGKVTIETGNTVLDLTYCTDHAGLVPGEYVLLTVSDNGCGMDTETLGCVFEPFFTTKESGTGLGLSTVYGVVKQNNGCVDVYSEPDQGTTFKIYLPRYLTKAAHLPDKVAGQPAERGQETILLVEDEMAILRMTTRMLERLGYTVVAASTPGEAIRLANEYFGKIHLLMTDVVMPEMNGRDLAKNILAFHPNLKRLFMSGYTANVIAHHGVLDEGVNFIQKPFSRENLSAKVREVLDADKD